MVSHWKREVLRFVRQRSRVVGALGTPVVFWLLIGSGLGGSFRAEGPGQREVPFLEYAFAGTLALIVLFTAIFAMISIIEDRKAGFLQAVIASPASRISIVAGKVLGSTTLALIQAGLFLALAPLIGVPLHGTTALAVVGVLFLVSIGLSGLGFLVAWPMESTQGFHAIMNLFLVPMWLLSGAFFPASGAAGWLRGIMTLNPLTYGVSAIRHALYPGPEPVVVGDSPMVVCLVVTVVFSAITIGTSVFVMKRSP